MAENFLNLVKDTNLQIQEARKNSNRINPKKSMPKHKITKFLIIKDKQKLLEEEKKNLLPIRKHEFKWQQSSHLKPWRPEGSSTTFSVLKKKNVNHEFCIWRNYTSRLEGTRHKLKECVARRSPLTEWKW